jgi:polysaccharide export outer membrane protein
MVKASRVMIVAVLLSFVGGGGPYSGAAATEKVSPKEGNGGDWTAADIDEALDELPPAYGETPYRLGAGDVLSIQFYGRPNLTRPQVTVAPDGTLSYLSATSVEVRGLTLEEARLRIEEALAPLYRNPRLIVTPIELASNSYTVIGMVRLTGVFALDSPITLVEAMARAGGTESGLFDRRYVDLADLDRSFIIREGRRLPVNFRRLLLEGDMSQNIALAPGDYIQIASALANDYFVLGAVETPGREGFTPGATVVAAITKREGFTRAAFRERVLVVRGSMTEPEAHVVNVREILRGARPDFPLEPKDIVFVSNRPWYRPEEILDRAVAVFLRSATATWTSANAPIIFTDPVVPGIRERDDP